MSISTSNPKTVARRRSHPLTAITAIAAVVALVAAAVATYAVASGNRSARSSAPTQASVLRDLTPAARQYVLAVASMPPVEVSAAFGTSPTSARDRHRGGSSTGSSTPTLASVLRSLTPSQRRYVLGIASLSPLQLWAAFGTTPTPPITHQATSTATASSASSAR